MWASRWKITIGRPRKTSSQSGYFFVFRNENRGGGGRRPIVTGLSRARIARTGHLFGGGGGREGEITESHCGPLLPRRGLSPIRLHFSLCDRCCFGAHPSLHALITICPSPRNRRLYATPSRFLLPFYGRFVTIREY